MAKLVGFEGGLPVQAAAGVADQVSPAGVLLVGSTVLGGWILGTAIGASIKEGAPVMEAEELIPGYMPSEVEEFLGVVAGTGAAILSGQVLGKLVDEFGWKTLGLYSLGLGALVLLRR